MPWREVESGPKKVGESVKVHISSKKAKEHSQSILKVGYV